MVLTLKRQKMFSWASIYDIITEIHNLKISSILTIKTILNGIFNTKLLDLKIC